MQLANAIFAYKPSLLTGCIVAPRTDVWKQTNKHAA